MGCVCQVSLEWFNTFFMHNLYRIIFYIHFYVWMFSKKIKIGFYATSLNRTKCRRMRTNTRHHTHRIDNSNRKKIIAHIFCFDVSFYRFYFIFSFFLFIIILKAPGQNVMNEIKLKTLSTQNVKQPPILLWKK